MAIHISTTNSYRPAAPIIPLTYTKTMTGDETFVYAGGAYIRCFLNPGGVNRNFNPSGAFPAGFKVELINTGAQDIIFDSTGINTTISADELGVFYWDGINWH